MFLSEYIEGLQKFLAENGDMEAYYSADDEGNSYQEVGFCGSKMFVRSDEINTHRPDLYCEEDAMAVYEEEAFTPVCVVN